MYSNVLWLYSVYCFLAYFPYFEINNSRLIRSSCCLYFCLSVYSPYQFLNAWTNLYETWYVYDGTWAQLNGILHKFFPSVCVSVCVFPPIVARKQLSRRVPMAANTCNCLFIPLLLLGNGNRLLEASFCMWSVLYQRKIGD
jgi:hypothetical protein